MTNNLELMDTLLHQWLLGQMQSIGILDTPGGQTEASMMLQVQPLYRRWLVQTLRMLEGAGQIVAVDGQWRVAPGHSASLEAVTQRWQAARAGWIADETTAVYVVLLESTLAELSDILRGKTRATDVLFPNGSTDRVQGVYKNNHVADHFNAVLADSLVRYVKGRIAHQANVRIRILEIGAGTGGTSGVLFAALAPYADHIAEYAYTDISKAFLQLGENRFSAAAPYLSARLLDIEQPCAPQGFTTGAYDVVVATNVLYATRDITTTVQHAKNLLKRNGLFFINEMIGSVPYLHLTFGLLEGWWRFEDDALRIPGSPGLLPETWEQVLRGQGYNAVLFPARDAHHLGQQLIVAQSDGVVAVTTPGTRAASAPVATVRAADTLSGTALLGPVRDFVTAQIAQALRMPAGQIDPDEPLSAYGLDSILTTQLSAQFTQRLGQIDGTMFFDHKTVNALSKHLIAHHAKELAQLPGLLTPPPAVTAHTVALPALPPAPAVPAAAAPTADTAPSVHPGPAGYQPIAIIGLSGRYAGAPDLVAFWDNLAAGSSTITEVPASRWNVDMHYHPDPAQAVAQLRSYSKWGGFLDQVGEFDPKFFKMVPRDAELTDPQELLFLEACWQALQDAGCDTARLSDDQRQRAGVFAGITKQYAFPPTSFASLANRVSYQLNLQGKSLALDTMCSSALVALHEACEYLQGEGILAVAGAVNLYLEPSKYVHLSLSRFVSSGPACKAFGDGDGFVPGEGVGAVVLKPLWLAERDGDAVYGVIRASAVNHNGRSAGYTSSDPERQAAVIRKALSAAGLDPRTISYIEAAANGIEMGDAIEMSALARVFATHEGVAGPRRIGSVKPNIGHCEAASGMSQLTKVLLSMRHQTLVPTLLQGRSNAHFNLSKLPFQIQETAAAWLPLTVDGVTVPRRAGITGIGAGGVNAHIVVEEYNAPPRPASCLPVGASLLFLWSAHTPAALHRLASSWLHHLEQVAESDLPDLAFTLQEGREAMTHRLAIIAGTVADLKHTLALWLADASQTDSCFSGNAKAAPVVLSSQLIEQVAQGQWRDLAQLWVLGSDLPPQPRLPGVRKVGQLPAYPFERVTVWRAREHAPAKALAVAPAPAPLASAPVNSAVAAREPAAPVYANNAEAFYALSTMGASQDYREQYLTLCPYPERMPGHSMTRLFMQQEKCPEEFAYMQSKQVEMRQVLFGREQFDRISHVFDIGCGMGTDVIQIARQFPHIRTEGYTITGPQAVLANERIARSGVAARARVYHRDSAKDAFPSRYDLIIGIEVICHIADKHAVFANIANALNDDGTVLMMDFIASGRGAISAPHIDIEISPRSDWIEVLSAHGLVIDELIDVSPQIANFLFDPDAEKNIAGLPKVAADSFRNFANNFVSLDRGWVKYCLFRLRKCPELSLEERRRVNAGKINTPMLYPAALERHLSLGRTSYPDRSAVTAGAAVPAVTATLAAPAVDDAVVTTLIGIFTSSLGVSTADVLEAQDLAGMGINSIHAVELTEKINACFNLRLSSAVLGSGDFKTLVAVVTGQLPAPAAPADAAGAPVQAGAAADIERALEQAFVTTLGIDVAAIHAVSDWAELGVTSIHAVALTEAINAALDLRLPSRVLFDHTSFKRLRDAVVAAGAQAATPVTVAQAVAEPAAPLPAPASSGSFAIVGLSCQFPGAHDAQAFWQRVEQGQSCISGPPGGRSDWREADKNDTAGVWGAFLDDVMGFDPQFFGILPKDAQFMSPEQRLLMFQICKAFEDAGIPWGGAVPTGLFVATGPSDYPAVLADKGYRLRKDVPSMLPNQISHVLDLRGPSECCEAACASALLAIHRAINAIEGGECRQAVVAAVNLILDPRGFASLDVLNVLSKDGQCHPFQAEARGYVRGEGAGAVLIKPLDAALADGDRIYAVIKGTGVVHGGAGRSVMAPNVRGMVEAMRLAGVRAGVAAASVGYIEAQGMASQVCDDAEMRALAAHYGTGSAGLAPCVIGSLKPVVGHCEYAAGMASLVKVIMALSHQVLPGIPNFKTRSPGLEIPPNFIVGAGNTPWTALYDNAGRQIPRRAAIHTFGIGGVNAHLVLEEHQVGAASTQQAEAPGSWVFPVSGRDLAGLKALAGQLAAFVEARTDVALCAIAATLQLGRVPMNRRAAVVASTRAQLLAGLRLFVAGDGSNGFVAIDGERAEALAPGQVTIDDLRDWAGAGRTGMLGRSWAGGADPSWSLQPHARTAPRATLPGYPFNKVPCMPPPAPALVMRATAPVGLDNSMARTLGIAETIASCVAALVGSATPIDSGSSLADLGLDSMARLALLHMLRAALDLDLNAYAVGEACTLDSLDGEIRGLAPDRAELPKTPVQASPVAPETGLYLQILGAQSASLRPELVRLADGTQVEVFFVGSGPRLVLVPGLGMAGSVFVDQLTDLAQSHEIMVYHYPGLGRSDSIGTGDIDQLAWHLLRTMATVGWDQASLLGWSFGGAIAQKAVLLQPQRWTSLILVSTFAQFVPAAGSATRPGAALANLYMEDLARVFGAADSGQIPLAQQQRITSLLNDSLALKALDGVAFLDALTRFDIVDALSDMAIPVLVIGGKIDVFDTMDHSNRLVSIIPGARIVMIDGAGHAPFMTHPRAFQDAVTTFLDEIMAVSMD